MLILIWELQSLIKRSLTSLIKTKLGLLTFWSLQVSRFNFLFLYCLIFFLTVTIWNFLTIPFADIPKFCFLLFDEDCTGEMDIEEIKTMLRCIHLSKDSASAESVADSLIEKNIQFFSLLSFTYYCKSHESLLYPIHVLQVHLKEVLMGASFWQEMELKR